MRKALTALCCKLSFQECLFPEQPWKTDTMSPSEAKTRHVLLPIIKDLGCLSSRFLSNIATHWMCWCHLTPLHVTLQKVSLGEPAQNVDTLATSTENKRQKTKNLSFTFDSGVSTCTKIHETRLLGGRVKAGLKKKNLRPFTVFDNGYMGMKHGAKAVEVLKIERPRLQKTTTF